MILICKFVINCLMPTWDKSAVTRWRRPCPRYLSLNFRTTGKTWRRVVQTLFTVCDMKYKGARVRKAVQCWESETFIMIILLLLLFLLLLLSLLFPYHYHYHHCVDIQNSWTVQPHCTTTDTTSSYFKVNSKFLHIFIFFQTVYFFAFTSISYTYIYKTHYTQSFFQTNGGN